MFEKTRNYRCSRVFGIKGQRQLCFSISLSLIKLPKCLRLLWFVVSLSQLPRLVCIEVVLISKNKFRSYALYLDCPCPNALYTQEVQVDAKGVQAAVFHVMSNVYQSSTQIFKAVGVCIMKWIVFSFFNFIIFFSWRLSLPNKIITKWTKQVMKKQNAS